MEIKNARIEKTQLGYEGRGTFTFVLVLRMDKASVAFGNYPFDSYDKEKGIRICSEKAGEGIKKLLDVVGVKHWEEMEGQCVRFEDPGIGQRITKIGNIVEDKWFDASEFFFGKDIPVSEEN